MTDNPTIEVPSNQCATDFASAPDEHANELSALDIDNGSSGSTFTFRQLIAASLACILLGTGLGMTYKTVRSREAARTQDRPTAVDIGFVNDMLDHHDQAVEMSLIALTRPGVSGLVQGFATEVIVFQRSEIGAMESRLKQWGETRAEPDRQAMAWMGMSTPLAQMPGLANPGQLNQLRTATNTDADRLFLELMTAHHRGGIHMAEYAAANATDDQIIELAYRMARNQKLEVSEYSAAVKGVGG